MLILTVVFTVLYQVVVIEQYADVVRDLGG